MVITAPFVVFKEKTMDKKEARDRQLAAIAAAVQAGQQDCDEKSILTHLYQSPEWQAAETVGVTISSGTELATRPIIQHALAAGKRVAVPRCLPHRQMAFWGLSATSHYVAAKSLWGNLGAAYASTGACQGGN